MPSFLESKHNLTPDNSWFKDLFKDKKRSGIIVLLVLLLGIPLTVWLAQRTQIFRPSADIKPIELISGEDSCVTSTDPNKVSCASFPIKLTSPLGPPTSASPSPSICPVPTPPVCPSGSTILNNGTAACPRYACSSPSPSPSPSHSLSPSPSASAAAQAPPAPVTTPKAFTCLNQNQVSDYVFNLFWPQSETGITAVQVSADDAFTNPFVSTTFVQSGSNMLAKGPGNFSNNFRNAFLVNTTYHARLMRGNTPGAATTFNVPSCTQANNFQIPWSVNFPGISSVNAQTNACSNLVKNHSFENPVVVSPQTNNGWLVYGANPATVAPTDFNTQTPIPDWDPRVANAAYQIELHRALFGAAADGLQSVEIDQPGIISLTQSIPTTAGAQYKIEFKYSSRPAVTAQQKLGVYWNGTQVGTIDGTTTRQSGVDWQTKTFNVTGIDGTSKLGFGALAGTGAGAGNLVDQVSVVQTSGACDPNPSTSPSPSASTEASSSPSPSSNLPGTSFYKMAETEAGLANAEQLPYTQHPTITDFTFSDDTPGIKQIWVEFIGADSSSRKEHISVELTEPGPVITSLDCSMDISRQNLKLTLNGSKLGDSGGKVTADSKEAQITSWNQNQVTAIVDPDGDVQSGKLYKVSLTKKDGQVFPEITCRVDTALISLGARLFCRAPGQFDVSGVKAVIIDENGNKVNEEVTIDSNGIINGLKTRLQVGKPYTLSIKAPVSLRKNADFIASNGTTIVTPRDDEVFILPVGDIFPIVLPDGKINTPDRSEIVRQWSVLGSGNTRTGDFNRDTKVNSIDWACMRYDFNKEDETIPNKATGNPGPSGTPVNPIPSPSVAVSPSTAASPSASAASSSTPLPSGQRSAFFLLEPLEGGSYQNGDEFIVDVNLVSRNEPANLFVAKISFDSSAMEVRSIEKGSALTTWAEEFYDNPSGRISLVAGRPSPGLKTTEGNDPRMARIIFRAKNVGVSEIKLTSESKIYSNVDNINILNSLLSAQIAITN